MDGQNPDSNPENITARPPTIEDVVWLCSKLEEIGCQYVVIGGFAMIFSGLSRTTADIDLLVPLDPHNEAKLYRVLSLLPDGCAKELQIGELKKYSVIRIADEFVIDIMANASGFTFEEVKPYINFYLIQNQKIPYASPEILYTMKLRASRPKDYGDIFYLQQKLQPKTLSINPFLYRFVHRLVKIIPTPLKKALRRLYLKIFLTLKSK